jgi:hypothetical protein
MGRIAILFGSLLMLLGITLYAIAVTRGIYWPEADPHPDRHPALRSLTSLIPTAFGVVLLILGMIARNASDKARMHTMHAAALIGLLGVALPLWRIIAALTGTNPPNYLAVGGLVGMAVLCAVFLALCVKSFIDARIARKQRELQMPGK